MTRATTQDVDERRGHTLYMRAYHYEGEGSNENRHYNTDNLAGSSMALVNERGAKAEC